MEKPCAACCDAARLARGAAISRLRVRPVGRKIKISAITTPRPISWLPEGSKNFTPSIEKPCSKVRKNSITNVTARTPMTAPLRLPNSADDQHRQGDKGHFQVELIDRHAAEELRIEASTGPDHRRTQREGDKPFTHDAHR